MKKLIALLLITTQAWAGLPPTSSKVSGDSSNVTTFNFQFPNLTGTHTGTTINIPTYPIPSPSPSSLLMDVSGAWSPIPFPSPSPSGQFVMATNTGFILSSPSGTAPGGVSGNVQYNSSGAFAGSNNLFWDIGNSRLGIGTSTPSVALDVNGAVRDRNLSTAGIVSTDSSGNLASASNASTFTTLYETVATTLGDIIYGGASGAPTRLAGNTTTAVQVLTSTGSGGLATAPTFQPITAIGISTDWSQAYTWTPASTPWGTIGANKIYSRRVGDSIQVQGYFVTGTVTANVASMALPSGLTIDSSKMGTATSATILGTYTSTTTSGTPQSIPGSSWSGNVFYDGSDVNNVYFAIQVQSGQLVKNNANGIAVSGEPFAVSFTVPITGWSSNTIGASQGAVYAHYFGSNASNAPGANLPFNFDSKIDDSGCLTGSCIVTTGASWKATAPLTGTYNGSILVNYSSGSVGNILLYKNGSFYEYLGEFNTNVSFVPMPFSINLQAGDTLDIRPSTGASFNGGAAPYQMLFSMSLQSGNGGGNISSSSTNSFHMESASVASAGTINSQSGSWLSGSCTNGSTGNYTCPVTAGEFSSAPTCTVASHGATTFSAINSTSTSQILVYTVAAASGGTFSNNAFDLICMGPK